MATLEIEFQVRSKWGYTLIAGLDEAGRGAIAGPVVAAAVILPLDQPNKLRLLRQVNDSKQLSPVLREELFDLIVEHALSYGVGSTPAYDIDQEGIIPANAQAMLQAVTMLTPEPEFLIIDGRMRIRNTILPQQSIIRGDSKSLSIAAASILAKVSRDRHMVKLDRDYPDYHFAAHKGYCTAWHRKALGQFGPCPVHRHSFAPIRRTLV
ncbi:MAG TPA: ribonuclease HII [Patescibacteria group bacterium]|jgi:ribonuclease HII|nr:ribonuclease HII [Patescibacteria group bacterium]